MKAELEEHRDLHLARHEATREELGKAQALEDQASRVVTRRDSRRATT